MTAQPSDASMEGRLTAMALLVVTYSQCDSSQWSNGRPSVYDI